MKNINSKMRFTKVGNWPVKVIIYVDETNEGTIIPDICIEIFFFGVLLCRKCIVL